MPRPQKIKLVQRMPQCAAFRACPGERCCGSSIRLAVEEFETLRLIDYHGLTQAECAASMGVARGTVQALYDGARKKVARFLVEGTALEVTGGEYALNQQQKRSGTRMKVAIPYENGQVFQHFGHTSQFKIYEVEDGAVRSGQVMDTAGAGHGALAGFLKEQGVDVLICGGIGGGARMALQEAGIALYGGAAGEADAQAAAFAAGSLQYDPDAVCTEHGHGHHGEGHDCGHHGEGHSGGGCHGGGHGCHQQ